MAFKIVLFPDLMGQSRTGLVAVTFGTGRAYYSGHYWRARRKSWWRAPAVPDCDRPGGESIGLGFEQARIFPKVGIGAVTNYIQRYNCARQMALTSGTKLGPYEIVSPLGAGGMGEVYRARDTRLDRAVAVKILPAAFSSDADRLHRFEHEARILSSLNHPNLLAIHDVGAQDGVHYLVSEFLEGQTLREKMNGGPLPQRKLTEYAVEVAKGLAAAHEKGIVHRDLKPENIFVTKDNRVKILDFGLAKYSSGATSGENPTMTGANPTTPGTVMGTVGYMAPEQVRGQAVDHRSDLFSFGAILYEMTSGKRAFKGDSSVETMNAILKEEPPELRESSMRVSPGLERIVRHCLEKEPGMRFQSARDLAFDLESLSSAASGSTAVAALKAPSAARFRTPLLAAVPVLLLAAAAAFWAGRTTVPKSNPVFSRLTFRGGHVAAARFAPDGQTLVYSAAFGEDPVQLYTTRPDSPQSRDLGLKGSSILAISHGDELALTLDHSFFTANTSAGTLAQLPLSGGAPRELAEGVISADWSPDGNALAVVRFADGKVRLEYPLGKVLYQAEGWISDARISPDGERVAFIDHPILFDSRGSVTVVDRAGNRKALTGMFSDVLGLVWHPSGKEIWFTGSLIHLSSNLMGVTLSGSQRLVWAGAGEVIVQDIAQDGRVLFIRQNRRRGIAGLFPGQKGETDLSWQDWSLPLAISADGKWVFFAEEGDGGGPKYSAYMRATDGSPAIRLGDGVPQSVSPDGKWVASVLPIEPQQLTLLPTRAGDPKNISQPGFNYDSVEFLPDGKRLLVIGNEPGKPTRNYLQNAAGGPLTAVTPEGVAGNLWLDGKSIFAPRDENTWTLYPIDGGQPKYIKALFPLRGGAGNVARSERYIFTALRTEVPQKISRFDPATGEKQLWKELAPVDRAGVYNVSVFEVTPDARWYVYSYVRDLSDLYMVEGLK
jgi:eukaryotic-like serine/threonine-protein kinase